MVLEDTIAAVSTPVGEGAISIVRLSGPQAVAIADTVFTGKAKLSEVSSHSLHHGVVVDPQENRIIDEVLVSLMRAPASYTGEDMVEINCHGSILITQKILEILLDCGARLALPGEFTRRAFLNGRMDLAQAEAVVDLIRAKADLSLQVAMEQLRGELSNDVDEIRQNIISALALVETELDFSDQELDVNVKERALSPIKRAQSIANRLLRGARVGKKLREGFTVVIVGRPNVGKSSLFNALLGTNRAIVTGIPGTTRDTISEQVELEGIPLWLVDTAGLHASKGLVEREGVRRTRQQMNSADLLLVILDGSEDLQKKDRQILRETEKQKGIVVINKSDLPKVLDLKKISSILFSRRKLRTSAKQGEGVKALSEAIWKELLNGRGSDTSEPLVTRVRHQDALKRAAGNIGRARRELTRGTNEEIVAVDLREALSALDQITGESFNEEILDHIFSHFCVGK